MGRTQEFGAESRGQIFNVRSCNAIVVTDPDHSLWDPTAEDPPPQWLVDEIEDAGRVRVALKVRKNGMRRGKPIVEIMDGRNRKKAVDVVNPRRKKQALPEILLPCVYERLDDLAAMDEMICGNELRKVEDHVTRAKRLERWLKFNSSDEKRARTKFGLKASEMRTLLTVLEMDPTVQKALKGKRITLAIAKRLADLPRNQQRKALAEVLDEAPKARGKEANDLVDDITRDARPRVKTFKKVEAALDNAACMPDSDYRKGVFDALEWMMGAKQAAWSGEQEAKASKKGKGK